LITTLKPLHAEEVNTAIRKKECEQHFIFVGHTKSILMNFHVTVEFTPCFHYGLFPYFEKTLNASLLGANRVAHVFSFVLGEP
jgi:hypothetical protein